MVLLIIYVSDSEQSEEDNCFKMALKLNKIIKLITFFKCQ